MPRDPEQLAHLEWLGYVQPVGLVVSIPALLAAQAQVNRNIGPEHGRFLAHLPRDKTDVIVPEIRDFGEFTRSVLGWERDDLTSVPTTGVVPEEFKSLEVVLPEYHETLRPTQVVREFEPRDGGKPWLMLIQQQPAGTDLDEPVAASERNWHASPHAKFERLLAAPSGVSTRSSAAKPQMRPPARQKSEAWRETQIDGDGIKTS
jgi:hypothetical protein